MNSLISDNESDNEEEITFGTPRLTPYVISKTPKRPHTPILFPQYSKKSTSIPIINLLEDEEEMKANITIQKLISKDEIIKKYDQKNLEKSKKQELDVDNKMRHIRYVSNYEFDSKHFHPGQAQLVDDIEFNNRVDSTTADDYENLSSISILETLKCLMELNAFLYKWNENMSFLENYNPIFYYFQHVIDSLQILYGDNLENYLIEPSDYAKNIEKIKTFYEKIQSEIQQINSIYSIYPSKKQKILLLELNTNDSEANIAFRKLINNNKQNFSDNIDQIYNDILKNEKLMNYLNS